MNHSGEAASSPPVITLTPAGIRNFPYLRADLLADKNRTGYRAGSTQAKRCGYVSRV